MTAIDQKYSELRGQAGFLGAPTTNETEAPDGVGRYKHFQRGSIYWTPSTGAWEVHDEIRAKWASLGWEKSTLGYPITDEINTHDGACYNNFQRGIIYLVKEPDITKSRTAYPHVIFHPGDRITIDAGGCVNPGGRGNSWRLYVTPRGPKSDQLYHGLIDIPNATQGLVRVLYVIGKRLEIPYGVGEPIYLTLGYEDDNFVDNGYNSPDNGVDDQCNGVGHAYVILAIER